jgi:hypothetical protein
VRAIQKQHICTDRAFRIAISLKCSEIEWLAICADKCHQRRNPGDDRPSHSKFKSFALRFRWQRSPRESLTIQCLLSIFLGNSPCLFPGYEIGDNLAGCMISVFNDKAGFLWGIKSGF